MTFKGLILMYIILLLTSVLALNIFSLLVFLGTRIFFWFAFNVPFELPSDDLIKYCKASTFAGVVIATGCWWIYYQRFRRNYKRK